MAYPPLSVGTDFTDDTPAVGVHADRHNVTAAAVNDVVAELGPNPKGTFETVNDRLDACVSSDILTGEGSLISSFDMGSGLDLLELPWSSAGQWLSSVDVAGHQTITWADLPAADTTDQGTVQFASTAETKAGTVASRAVSVVGAAATFPRTLFNLYADISTTSTGGSFDDLQSVTLAAGQLASNGDRLVAQWVGQGVAHATATRQVRAVFGGTTVIDTSAYVTNSGTPNWVWGIEIIRVSSSVVRVSVGGNNPAYSALSPLPFAAGTYTEVTGLTLANSQVLKITAAATGAGAASGDITGRSLTVSYFPAP